MHRPNGVRQYYVPAHTRLPMLLILEWDNAKQTSCLLSCLRHSQPCLLVDTTRKRALSCSVAKLATSYSKPHFTSALVADLTSPQRGEGHWHAVARATGMCGGHPASLCMAPSGAGAPNTARHLPLRCIKRLRHHGQRATPRRAAVAVTINSAPGNVEQRHLRQCGSEVGGPSLPASAPQPAAARPCRIRQHRRCALEQQPLLLP